MIQGYESDEIYISIPDDKWNEFAEEFSVQVYNNKADYKRNSLIITVLLAFYGRRCHLFYNWACTQTYQGVL